MRFYYLNIFKIFAVAQQKVFQADPLIECLCMCVNVYICVCVCVCVYIYIYVLILMTFMWSWLDLFPYVSVIMFEAYINS